MSTEPLWRHLDALDWAVLVAAALALVVCVRELQAAVPRPAPEPAPVAEE